MSGHFKIKKITDMGKVKEGSKTKFPESDYSLLVGKKFYQFDFQEQSANENPVEVHPKIYSMIQTNFGIKLVETHYTDNKLLDGFLTTQQLEEKIYAFFSKLNIYKEMGRFAKRCVLLYGPPGTGKSSTIRKVITKFMADNKTSVIIWPTDKIEAGDVKNFLKRLTYHVEKLIFVVEDIGGIEMENARMRSESSLLALLDNEEQSFKIPTQILATTNYPEALLPNITRRPGRVDDLVSLQPPSAEAREQLLKFFMGVETLDKDLSRLITSKLCNEFTPAHLSEVVIRSKLYDMTMDESIRNMAKDIEKYKNSFVENKQSLGFGSGDDD